MANANSDRDFNKDDGQWFPVMHEFAEKVAKINLKSTQHQVLWMFIRYCWGYNRSSWTPRWTEMMKLTGLSKGTLSKAIKVLEASNIIKCFPQETKKGITYKINSKLSTWKQVASYGKMFPTGNKNVSHRKQKCFPQETLPYKTNKNINTLSSSLPERQNQNNNIPYLEIINFLNQQANKNFKHTTKETKRAIKARWNDGFCFDDFKKVIRIKSEKWKNDPKMVDYLRPQTLFGTKFEAYLNESYSQKCQSTSKEVNSQTVEDLYANP